MFRHRIIGYCLFIFISKFDRYCQLNGEGNGIPLQYSCLENPMDGGAWWATVHGVVKSRTRLSDLTFTFHFHALEKEMATHSSVLAWRIPGMGEPGGLPSMGSHRIGHNWSDLAAAAAAAANLIPKMVVKDGGTLMKCECNRKRKTYLCHPWCSELTKTLGSRGIYKFQELAIHSLPANNQVGLIY